VVRQPAYGSAGKSGRRGCSPRSSKARCERHAARSLGSGARRGELLVLRWHDVDFDNGTMQVERAVEQTKQGITVKPPKTRHGPRTITLAPVTVDVLRAHWRTQQEHWLASGRARWRR
jgi:integrase